MFGASPLLFTIHLQYAVLRPLITITNTSLNLNYIFNFFLSEYMRYSELEASQKHRKHDEFIVYTEYIVDIMNTS